MTVEPLVMELTASKCDGHGTQDTVFGGDCIPPWLQAALRLMGVETYRSYIVSPQSEEVGKDKTSQKRKHLTFSVRMLFTLSGVQLWNAA